jgi:hypothetical protein
MTTSEAEELKVKILVFLENKEQFKKVLMKINFINNNKWS